MKEYPPGHTFSGGFWMGWLKKELDSRNIATDCPEMPDPWNPVYDEYKKEFEKYRVDENTILVGHSRGCAFLVRWLGNATQKVKKLLLVAPYKIAVGDNLLKKEFYRFDIDAGISERVNDIVIFTSDDEDKEGILSARMYHKALGGKIISLKNHGHYTMDKFPEILQEMV